jgi:selenocysteine lyase/cysteine desulfurase
MHRWVGLRINGVVCGPRVERATTIRPFLAKLDGNEPIEVGTALDEEGIAVRGSHHCAQPILRRFGLENTVRLTIIWKAPCSPPQPLTAPRAL